GLFVTKLNATGSGLVYSTFLWGNGNVGTYHGIAVDTSGNAYVVGSTASTDFPTTPGAFQTAFGGGTGDGFITKLNPAGSALVYSTFVGSSGGVAFAGIAVDSAGEVFTTGYADSTGFPTTAGAYQTVFGGGSPPGDAVVVKL